VKRKGAFERWKETGYLPASPKDMTTLRMIIKENAPPIAWGKPDSPVRELCAICHGALPEVPLMIWDDTGRGATLCNACVDKWITIEGTSADQRHSRS